MTREGATDRRAAAIVDLVSRHLSYRRDLSPTSWLANETFRILDPLADERVPHRDRCTEAQTDIWSNPVVPRTHPPPAISCVRFTTAQPEDDGWTTIVGE